MRTDHVIHGLPGYLDYDRVWTNRRQVLVTDTWSTVWSNFLAIFLAWAGGSLFNIIGRFTWAKPKPVQTQDASDQVSVVDTTGDSVSETDVSVSEAADDADIALPTLPPAVMPPTSTQSLDPLVTGPGSTGAGSGSHTDSPQPNQRPPTQQTEMSGPQAAGDMMINGLVEFFERFKEAIVGLAVDQSLLNEMLTWKFWVDASVRVSQISNDLGRNLAMGLIGSFFYFGILALGIASAYPVVGNSVAVSQSPQCGFFTTGSSFSDNATKVGFDNQYWNEIIRESRQYAKSCYPGPDSKVSNDASDSCSFFYQPAIPYTVHDNVTCPFKLGDSRLCLDGEYGAFQLHTGSKDSALVDASVLGINSPLPYKFARGLTCSPLQTKDRIANKRNEDDVMVWRYFYGNRTGVYDCGDDVPSCTFELPSSPGLKKSYDLFTTNTFATNPSSGEDPEWQPIFDFNKKESGRATIALISNAGIFYAEESLDPIFPAQKNTSEGWYFNSLFHANMLGCISTTTICYGASSPPQNCWSLDDFVENGYTDSRDNTSKAMLLYSLLPSIDEELRFMGAESLDVQSRLFDYHSSSIPSDQWKTEVRGMFETLLARTQMQTRNIARGVSGRDVSRLENLLGPEYHGMCTRYKFQSVGWKNLSFWHFFAEFAFGLVVCFVGIRRKDGHLWVEKHFWTMIESRAARFIVTKAKQVAGLLRR